jgi:protein-tyrosine phosphatase
MSEWFDQYGFGEVHPRLLVGAVPLDANDVQAVADQHVDRVLNLVQDPEYPDGARLEVEIGLQANGIAESRVQVVDFGNLSPTALESAVTQVDAWLAEGHTVYLHCRAGWQRSATVAAGVIALREGVPIDTALARLESRKPTARPLPHQAEDLRAWWAARPPTS